MEKTTRQPQRCLRAPQQIFNRKRIFCSQYFVQLLRGKVIPIALENKADTDVTIYKNTTLGFFEVIPDGWLNGISPMPKPLPVIQLSKYDLRHVTQAIDSSVPPECRNKFKDLVQEYKSVFSKSEWDLGKCDAIPHKTEVYPGAKPVKLPNRRMPLHYKHDLQDKLDIFLEKDLIAPCHSPYSAPAMLVPKKNGKLRLVIDYRQLNKQTIKSSWPIPSIEEIFDTLEGSSSLLQSTCLQVFIKSQWTQPVKKSPLSVLPSAPSNGFACQWVSREAQILSRI